MFHDKLLMLQYTNNLFPKNWTLFHSTFIQRMQLARPPVLSICLLGIFSAIPLLLFPRSFFLYTQ